MNIYILRHGKAENAGAGSDANRRLTPEGIEGLKAECTAIEKRMGRPDCILTSPLARADETARIVGEHIGCADLIEVSELLAAPRAEDKIIKTLNSLTGKENVLLVGHMPYLSDLILRMIPQGPGWEDVNLKKGGLAKVVFKGAARAHEGRLEWVATPKELRNDK